MNLQIHCPYCKRPVAASLALVGQRIACPNCRGEMVLNPAALLAPAGAGKKAADGADLRPPTAAVAAPVAATAVAAPAQAPMARYAPAPQAPLPQAPLPQSPLPQSPLPQPAPQNPASPNAASAATTQPARPNTAQFLAGQTQAPTIAPAADGKLPELQLADSPELAPRVESQAAPIPIWLALMAVVASTLISVLLVTHDFDGSQANTTTKTEARQQLAAFYGNDLTPLAPFQVHLREAQLAHSRGDFTAERDRYRKVLALLRAEGRSKFEGLTGTPNGDTELARLLSILLAN